MTSTEPGRRVLVTGSRTWTDTRTIRDALAAEWGQGRNTLITGACPRGADRLAEQCWRAWGGHVERHPADWDRHGRAAGFRRNAAMISDGADVCLAFVRDHSRGATHTATLAAQAGIPVRRFAHPESAPREPGLQERERLRQLRHDPPADALVHDDGGGDR